MENENLIKELLDISLKELEKTNQDLTSAGACIFTPPSGRPQCFQLTPSQCSAIKGLFVGGPCKKLAEDDQLRDRIEKIKSETSLATGIAIEDLSYLTVEFITEADHSKINKLEENDGNPEGKLHKLEQWGTYGNSYWFEGGLCKWKQNKKGTPNYGCGTSETWEAGKTWCSYITQKGKCADGKYWYFLGNYNG